MQEAGQRLWAGERRPTRQLQALLWPLLQGMHPKDLRAARKSHESNQNSAEDGTQSGTAVCLPPALPPTLTPMQGWRRAQCQALLHPPAVVQPGPARSGSRGTPRRPAGAAAARGAGALPKHILTECLQTGCPGRALNCTCFFLYFLLFCFLKYFLQKEKKDFIQAIYKWISIIT